MKNNSLRSNLFSDLTKWIQEFLNYICNLLLTLLPIIKYIKYTILAVIVLTKVTKFSHLKPQITADVLVRLR